MGLVRHAWMKSESHLQFNELPWYLYSVEQSDTNLTRHMIAVCYSSRGSPRVDSHLLPPRIFCHSEESDWTRTLWGSTMMGSFACEFTNRQVSLSLGASVAVNRVDYPNIHPLQSMEWTNSKIYTVEWTTSSETITIQVTKRKRFTTTRKRPKRSIIQR